MASLPGSNLELRRKDTVSSLIEVKATQREEVKSSKARREGADNRVRRMKTERFAGHHEGWRALWLAIAGVMAITLTWNVLMLSLNGISY